MKAKKEMRKIARSSENLNELKEKLDLSDDETYELEESGFLDQLNDICERHARRGFVYWFRKNHKQEKLYTKQEIYELFSDNFYEALGPFEIGDRNSKRGYTITF